MSKFAAALRLPFTLLRAPAFRRAPDAVGGAARINRWLAVLVFALGSLILARTVLRGALPSLAQVLLLMLAFALYTNRGGRFLRDWVPVFVGALAYVVGDHAVQTFDFPVHYTPQLDGERLLAFGTVPTIWLQSHLYTGSTGPLEVFATVMYVSHFFAPLLLGFFIWAFWGRRGFRDLFFGILAVTLLGEITFVLAPTAPPWLAAQQGLLPPVHDVIKHALGDMGLPAIAEQFHSTSYNVVAAVPSLHAAWPLIGLFVVLKHRLPRWVLALQASLVAGVLFSIVYTGEHYVVDALVGGLYAAAAWWLVQRALAPRMTRAGRA